MWEKLLDSNRNPVAIENKNASSHCVEFQLTFDKNTQKKSESSIAF